MCTGLGSIRTSTGRNRETTQTRSARRRLEGQGEDSLDILEYHLDIDKKAHHSVYAQFGFMGRGTTVVPVKGRLGAGAMSGVQTLEGQGRTSTSALYARGWQPQVKRRYWATSWT